MNNSMRVERSLKLQLLGILVFCGGGFLLTTGRAGIVIGLAVMLIAMQLGYRKRRVWECPACGQASMQRR